MNILLIRIDFQIDLEHFTCFSTDNSIVKSTKYIGPNLHTIPWELTCEPNNMNQPWNHTLSFNYQGNLP